MATAKRPAAKPAEKKVEKKATLPETVPLYNVNDAVIDKRTGGPYLDDVMAERQEKINALREGREPDLSTKHLNTVAHPGLQLVTEDQFRKIDRRHGAELDVPVYGEIANPALADQKAREEELKAMQRRQEEMKD